VITWQTALLANERNDIEITQRRFEASVLLIKALGGDGMHRSSPSNPESHWIANPARNFIRSSNQKPSEVRSSTWLPAERCDARCASLVTPPVLVLVGGALMVANPRLERRIYCWYLSWERLRKSKPWMRISSLFGLVNLEVLEEAEFVVEVGRAMDVGQRKAPL